MMMASRIPRQVVAFEAVSSVCAEQIQRLLDSVNHAKKYHTDGAPISGS